MGFIDLKDIDEDYAKATKIMKDEDVIDVTPSEQKLMDNIEKQQNEFFNTFEEESTNMLEKRKEIDYSNLPPNAVVSPKGTVYEKGTGKFLPGYGDNKSGKYSANFKRQISGIKKYLSIKIGKDGNKLLDRIVEQALYEYPGEGRRKFSEFTVNKSQEILLRYFFGNPTDKVEIDKRIDVQVEHKLDEALKLIHMNRNNLKVIEGGNG